MMNDQDMDQDVMKLLRPERDNNLILGSENVLKPRPWSRCYDSNVVQLCYCLFVRDLLTVVECLRVIRLSIGTITYLYSYSPSRLLFIRTTPDWGSVQRAADWSRCLYGL